jgi:hypothetical protein
MDVDTASDWGRTVERVRRHLYWARTQGVGRLVEEDDLDLRQRTTRAYAKWQWRRRDGGPPGGAVPVFLVGVQRSGTNMVVRGLEASPQFEVHNENDRRAFDRFRLRPLPDIRAVVERSRHRFVLFKPLCDSHRTDELLDRLDAASPARAIWAYRSVDGRVASALAKFGDTNLRVLRELAGGGGRDRWQAQRLSPAAVDLVAGFDYDTMSPETAAALFWYVRNTFVFELGLDHRPDVAVVSYDALLAAPEARMRELCSFLGTGYDPRLVTHIDGGRVFTRQPVDIDPRVRRLCTDLESRLDALRPGSPALP